MIIDSNRINEIISETIDKELKRVMDETILHANCFGVRRGLVEYRESEREDILIVERRSVAAYIYRDEIKKLSNIVSYLINAGNYQDVQFDLNANRMNFDLSKEFVVWIQFSSGEEEAEYLPGFTVINDGVVERVVIAMTINPTQHNESLFSQLFFHEINHCKEDIERIKNNQPSLLRTIEAKIKYQDVYNNIRIDITAYLIYSLFVDTELNAFVSQFYSELQDSNTERRQFSEFFKLSMAYKRYDGLIYIIEQLDKQKGWEKQTMRYFNIRFKSVDSFRSWFLGRAKYKASKMYNKLCKVANLYYDTIEGKI